MVGVQSSAASGENVGGSKSPNGSPVIGNPTSGRVSERITVTVDEVSALPPSSQLYVRPPRCATPSPSPGGWLNKENVGAHSREHYSAIEKQILLCDSVGKPADIVLPEISPPHRSSQRVQCWKRPFSDRCV